MNPDTEIVTSDTFNAQVDVTLEMLRRLASTLVADLDAHDYPAASSAFSFLTECARDVGHILDGYTAYQDVLLALRHAELHLAAHRIYNYLGE